MSKSKLFIGIVVVLLAIVGIKVVMTLNGPSDAKLIQQALAESIKASREGRPGGVMDYLSDKLKINNDEPGRRQVADFIKNSHPDVEVADTTPVIREVDGTAQINSSIHLKMSMLGNNVDQTIKNVTLKFQREDAKEWLIIPTKQWRLVEVAVPQESIPNIPGIGP